MAKREYIQREIIYDSDSIVRSTNKNMGLQMEDTTQWGYETYHSHPEYQLMLLTNGSIDLVVADRIKKYSKGDILLLGCNLPHYLKGNSWGEGVLIQFPCQIFPSNMNQMPDYTFINSLINNADGGLLFSADKSFKAKTVFEKIHNAKGIDRICILLQLLSRLGKKLNDSETICYLSKEIKEDRPQMVIAKCKKYLRTNYNKELTLQQIARIANLNKTALCRTFRRETGETIFQYIIRLRIEAAFKLLRNTDLGIGEIAYECGFNSLPHFNKKFKEISNLSPSEYKQSMFD